MVKLIEHLSDFENGVLAMTIKVAAPATDKLVIVQSVNNDGSVSTIGARYREGRWYGEERGEDLTEELLASSNAIWAESFLFTDNSCHRHVNSQ